MILRFGVTPEIVSGGDKPFGNFPPSLTPLTAMFMHGSWDHLLVNIIYLWVFGEDIEDVLGPFRFALFYILSGICGALGYVAADTHATIPLVGASGNIAGLLTAYLMLKPCEPVAVPSFRGRFMIASYWAIGVWILLQLFQFLWHGEEEMFTNQAFLGGVIGGAVLFVVLRPRGLKLFQCLAARDHDLASQHDS